MKTFRKTLRPVLRMFLALGAGSMTVSCLLVSDRPDFYRCNSQRDCLANEICEFSGGSIGTCYPIGYCRFDSECSSDQACVGERCTAVQCTDSTASSVCQMYACTAQHTCRTTCATIADCQSYNGQGYHCAAGACVVNECDYHDECISGYLCSGGVCRKPCTTSAECVAPATCASGYCF